MSIINVEPLDVMKRLAIEPDHNGQKRLGVLIEDAEALIVEAFGRRGRSFSQEYATFEWLQSAARRVVLEMVSAAVIIGGNVGQRSATSTTGPQSDSVTWADVDSVSWAGVKLTPEHLAALGLSGGLPRGRFPEPLGWPERTVHEWKR
ncbi:Gp19/Gp15/Gp42 family protein [Corynebacterium rouxii]|uniref:Gp19/Gp15/Gp42 family protein n=1 Tax=Corynebacterium rouxii TaxID=2719119 RepID=A0ABU3PNA2_9CORY|nr:Gp19/Gp15/Gp42 family protein [Corynebacterium rouxii]MDT9411312.1 Gp19/Gp15/Gp42 family protein [Corynebacterium rouxii]